MFKIKFGALFTLIGLIAMIVFKAGFGTGDIEVNGVFVPQDEGSGMLFPLLCMAVFVVVGIAIMISGFIEVKRNKETEKYGKETYCLVANILPNGVYQNGKPQYKTIIMMEDEDGNVRKLEDTIGFDPFKIQTGKFYKIKYYKNDFNFIDLTQTFVRDEKLSEKLMAEYKNYNSSSHFSINDGSEDGVNERSNGRTEFVDPDDYDKE